MMKNNLLRRMAASANIQSMASSGSNGAATAAKLETVPLVSRERLEEIRRPWTSAEKKEEPPKHHSLKVVDFLRSSVTGFGNLLSIFPPRRRREVYIPPSTAEEQIKEAWTEIGCVLCEVARSHDSTKK